MKIFFYRCNPSKVPTYKNKRERWTCQNKICFWYHPVQVTSDKLGMKRGSIQTPGAIYIISDGWTARIHHEFGRTWIWFTCRTWLLPVFFFSGYPLIKIDILKNAMRQLSRYSTNEFIMCDITEIIRKGGGYLECLVAINVFGVCAKVVLQICICVFGHSSFALLNEFCFI